MDSRTVKKRDNGIREIFGFKDRQEMRKTVLEESLDSRICRKCENSIRELSGFKDRSEWREKNV